MRSSFLGVGAIALVLLACSSGSDTLAPGPNTDLDGGGAKHGNDTTITSNPQTPPPTPPVVSSFTLTGGVYGHEPGPDTMVVVVVPNAKVTLVKVGSVDGDTLKPSVTVATTTTDQQGGYRLENLAPAYYRIDVTAPVVLPFGCAP